MAELIVEAMAKLLWAYHNELVTMDTWDNTPDGTKNGFRLQARELITKGILTLGDEHGPKSGLALIAAERRRQIAEEGYTAAEDDLLVRYELTHAALCYIEALNASWPLNDKQWPFNPHDFKPRSRKDNLVRAGAFIAAEIDRINRRDK